MLRTAAAILGFSLLAAVGSAGDDNKWVDLFAHDFDAFKTPTGEWLDVGDVRLDPKNARKFITETGKGVHANSKGSKHLHTKQKFGDLELHLELNLPKGSNAG